MRVSWSLVSDSSIALLGRSISLMVFMLLIFVCLFMFGG
jgi:hypothetical protein